MFNKGFFYKKVVIENETHKNFYWYLINKESREGVHFHGSQAKQNTDFLQSSLRRENSHRFSSYGIEAHKKTPMYEGQKALENCEVTLGDCYCDGSSLSASERLGHVNPDEDDRYIYIVLHEFYESWID